MLYFPVKSLPNSANPSGFNTYKIRKNNPLHFQHLRDPFVSAHSKGTSTPADSTLTRPLSLTPLESTLTKNRGRGVGVITACPERSMREVNQNSAPDFSRAQSGSPLLLTLVYPEHFSRGALSLQRAKCISHLSNRLRTFARNYGGVPQLFPMWNGLMLSAAAATGLLGTKPARRCWPFSSFVCYTKGSRFTKSLISRN